MRSGKKLKTEEGKARARGRRQQENAKISQNLKSLWNQVDHLVRVRSSNASSSEVRWQEDYKEVVIALTVSGPKGHCLTMSSFHACFLTSSSISSFIAFCLLGSQCDRMVAISYYELSFIASNLTTWGLRSLWWWFWPHHHFSSSASSLSCYWMFALS